MGRPKKVSLDEFRQTNGKVENSTLNVKDLVKASTPETSISAENPITLTKEVAGKIEEVEKPLNQYVVHGQLTPEASNNITNLLKKYRKDSYGNYSSSAEYSNSINKMNLNDLHRHAIDVSIIPTTDKDKLIRQLENAFGVYINKGIPRTMQPSNLSQTAADNIKNIIAKKTGKAAY